MADDRQEQDHHDHQGPRRVLQFPSDLESYNLVATIRTTRNNVVVYKAAFNKHLPAGGGEAETETETVAIKAIPFDSNSAAAFAALVRGAEASVSARPHPNLVLARHFFLDAASSRLCAVLPFAPGGSIASVTTASFTYGFFEEGISAILKEVLKALAHLHRLGIPHRDVKPGNILVRGDAEGENGSYTICLADLGLSTSFHHPAANTDCGGDDDAPYWTAPEALRSPGAYTPKSDIWAMGVTALELSYGRPPLARRVPTTAAMRLKIRDRFDWWEYEDTVFNFLWELSETYTDMVALCLKKDPSERPSAEELLAHPFFSINAGDNVRPDAFHIKWSMRNLPDVDKREIAEPEPVGGGLSGTEAAVYRRIAGWELNEDRCFLEAVFDNEPTLSEALEAAAASGDSVRVGEALDRFLGAVIDNEMSSSAAAIDDARLVEGLIRVGRRLEEEEDREAVMEAVRRIEAAEMGRAAAEAYAEMLCSEVRRDTGLQALEELELELNNFY